MKVSERVGKLRELMKENSLAAYVVPSTDPHASEYVADAWQRRKYISGFDGSAGTVVIGLDSAGLWTDSRYFLQAEEQLAGSGIDLFKMGEPGVPSYEEWICSAIAAKTRVGVDPMVFSDSAYQALEAALRTCYIALCPVGVDLVDVVWGSDRPAMPCEPMRPHALEYAGVTVAEKLRRMSEYLRQHHLDAHLVAGLDELAWLFNLRGADVAHNPVFIGYAIVEPDSATLFVDQEKVGPEVRDNLPAEVRIEPYQLVEERVLSLAQKSAAVWIDPQTVSWHLSAILAAGGAKVVRHPGVIPDWKSVKNEAEATGMRACHVRDGAAMVRFLHWLEGAVPQGGITEMSVAEKLADFRKEDPTLVGTSFETISAYGGHGAIVHYRVTPESDVAVLPEGLFLIDSGGQYIDGTTDITRTIAAGTPTAEHRRVYTRVLQGHLRLTRTRFREGTNGYQLDVLARAPLWAGDLDYGHGTGHGVGAALCVHEGPFSVSLRKNLTPLRAGNILSIEPGFYKSGAYGVRIENLVLVVRVAERDSGVYLGFRNLTMCPYDRRLIDISMLCREDVAQINEYHTEVRGKLLPLVHGEVRAWLERATEPI
jgi:Xaa-Pro aminopeptidase